MTQNCKYVTSQAKHTMSGQTSTPTKEALSPISIRRDDRNEATNLNLRRPTYLDASIFQHDLPFRHDPPSSVVDILGDAIELMTKAAIIDKEIKRTLPRR